jgi:hypothetical protein
MSSRKVCTFCLKKGIAPYHTHTVRNWKLTGKPIICPELLANICSCCGTSGHTRQYCPTRPINPQELSAPINELKRTLSDSGIINFECPESKSQKIQ